MRVQLGSARSALARFKARREAPLRFGAAPEGLLTPPRWATHAAYMLGNEIQAHLLSPAGEKEARSKGAAREFGSPKWSWPASVASLCWGQCSIDHVASIVSMSGGNRIRDDKGAFWGVWLSRLLLYSEFTPDDRRASFRLPLFPHVPGSMVPFSRRELAALFLREQEDGRTPFRIHERFPTAVGDEIRPSEDRYVARCAAAMREASTEPLAVRDAKFEVDRQFTYWEGR